MTEEKLFSGMDNIVLIFYTFTLFTAEIFSGNIEDIFNFMIAYLGYSIWSLYIYFRGNISYLVFNERKYIEKTRGIAYIISLLITILCNYLALRLFPSLLSLIFIPMVGLLLFVVMKSIINYFYKYKERLMNKKSIKTLEDIFKDTLSVSIWMSLSILNTNINLLQGDTSNMFFIIILVLSQMVFLYRIYIREKGARQHSNSLAQYFKNTNWLTKYTNLRYQSARTDTSAC